MGGSSSVGLWHSRTCIIFVQSKFLKLLQLIILVILQPENKYSTNRLSVVVQFKQLVIILDFIMKNKFKNKSAHMLCDIDDLDQQSPGRRSHRAPSDSNSNRRGSSKGGKSNRNSSSRMDKFSEKCDSRLEDPKSSQKRSRQQSYAASASKNSPQRSRMDKDCKSTHSVMKSVSAGRNPAHPAPSTRVITGPYQTAQMHPTRTNEVTHRDSNRYGRGADGKLSKNQDQVSPMHGQGQLRRSADPHGFKYFCIFPGNGYQIIRNAIMAMPDWKEVKKDDVWKVMASRNHHVNFVWKPTNFNYRMYCHIDAGMQQAWKHYLDTKSLGRELVINHLEGHRELTTKTGLIRTLKYYYKDDTKFVEGNYQVFDTTPTSFVVSSKLETYEYHQFIKRFEDLHKGEGTTIKERVPQKHCLRNMWLIKPANENQGKGIKIFDSLDQIVRFLETSITFSYWVIQKYLEKPLLFKGRKFDIRMWGFAQSNLDFYFYDTGYLRTSSQEYSMDNKEDEYVHLTNNCLQIKNKDLYGIHEEGNVVSIEQFQEYLTAAFPRYQLDFNRDFLPRMKDIAIDCYLSAKQTLNPTKRRNSFAFFGFDFMIDEDFRVWLIEVNTNPYIGIHNKSMKHIFPEMFADLFKVVLDPVFDPSQDPLNDPDNLDIQDRGGQFDLLYSRARGINKRRGVQEGIYPIKELDSRKTYRKFKKKQPKKSFDQSCAQYVEQHQRRLSDRRPSSKKRLLPENVEKFNNPLKPGNRDEADQENLELVERRKGRKLDPSGQSPKPQTFDQGEAANSRQKNQNQLVSLNATSSEPYGTPHKSGSTKHQRTISEIHLGGRKEQNPDSSQLKRRDKLFSLSINQSDMNARDAGAQRLLMDGACGEDLQPVKIKPPKSIVQQVTNMDRKSQFIKQQSQEILNRIVATLTSWELFSDQQILDAITALKTLYQTINFCQEQQIPITRAITKLVGSNEVPTHIRHELSQKLLMMIKNKVFVRLFMQDPCEAFEQLYPLYCVLHESCLQNDMGENEDDDDDDDDFHSEHTLPDQEELQYECCIILVYLMALNNRKYYIPGETSEKAKQRQKGMSLGIMIVLMNTLLKTQNQSVKQYLQEEFLERLEESDIQSHFQNNHAYYERVQDIIADSSVKQAIDDSLIERLDFLRESRERDQRLLVEKRKEEEQRELLIKQEYDRAMQERRRLAEERMQQRLKELQKLQSYQLKQELQMKEEQDRQNEIRKQQMLEELRKKQEQRKQFQLELVRKKKLEEKEIEEQEMLRRAQREQSRKLALDEWHRSKRAEDKRKNITLKQYYQSMNKKQQLVLGCQKEESRSAVLTVKPDEAVSAPPLKKKFISQTRRQPNGALPLQSYQQSTGLNNTMLDETFLKNANISQLNKIHKNMQARRNEANQENDLNLGSGLSMVSSQRNRKKQSNDAGQPQMEKKGRYFSTPQNFDENQNQDGFSAYKAPKINEKYQLSHQQPIGTTTINRLYKSTIEGEKYDHFENHSQNLKNFRQAQEEESKNLIKNVSQRCVEIRNGVAAEKSSSPFSAGQGGNNQQYQQSQMSQFGKRQSVKSSKFGAGAWEGAEQEAAVDPAQILGKIKQNHRRGISEIGLPQKYHLKLKPIENSSTNKIQSNINDSLSLSKEQSNNHLNIQEILQKGSKQSLPALEFSNDNDDPPANQTESRQILNKFNQTNKSLSHLHLQIQEENKNLFNNLEDKLNKKIAKVNKKTGSKIKIQDEFGPQMPEQEAQDDNQAGNRRAYQENSRYQDTQIQTKRNLRLAQTQNQISDARTANLNQQKKIQKKIDEIVMSGAELKDLNGKLIDKNQLTFQNESSRKIQMSMQLRTSNPGSAKAVPRLEDEVSPYVQDRGPAGQSGEFSLPEQNPSDLQRDPASSAEYEDHSQQNYSKASDAQTANADAPKITIINNNFSQINYNQNVNIQKYVKKKKKRASASSTAAEGEVEHVNAQTVVSDAIVSDMLNQHAALASPVKEPQSAQPPSPPAKKGKNSKKKKQQNNPNHLTKNQQSVPNNSKMKDLIHQIYSVPITTKNQNSVGGNFRQSQIQLLLGVGNSGSQAAANSKTSRKKEESSQRRPQQMEVGPLPLEYAKHSANELSIESNLAGYSISGGGAVASVAASRAQLH